MPPKPVAVIAFPLTPETRARIEAVATIREAGPRRENLLGALAGARGLLCGNNVPVNGELLDAGPDLRVVSGYGVGYDRVDVPEATSRGVAVCNTPGVLSNAVADLTIAFILSASRRVWENAEYVRSGGWSSGGERPPLGFDVEGKVLGLLGFGRIGQAVALRARAFGMSVRFYDLVESPPPGFEDCLFRPFDDLLRESDIVSIHLDLNPHTHHLVGAKQLALMKPTALLVNTARGPIVDQEALAAALRDDRIAGAGLDVLEDEPPRAGEAILAHPKAVILPHVGSATVETRQAMLDLAVDNLVAGLTGEAPPACVNPEVLGQ